MRVLHTIASLRADHGGPARSLVALSEALALQGLEVTVITQRRQAGEPEPLTPCPSRVTTHFVPRSRMLGMVAASAPHFGAALRAQIADALDCVVHDHGIWLPTNHAAAMVARTAGVPRIVSPRGMLSTWALHFHRWRKRAAWFLYQWRDIQQAHVLHATSQEELSGFREAGLRQPVALVANGVRVPNQPTSTSRDRTRRRALFLSRIHPKKGLSNLIAAWAQVRPEGWTLVIAGPEENGHWAKLEALARREGVLGEITYLGPVPDEEKWRVYQQADLFVLPTFSENFGIVVAEALASRLPVITTKAAPWQGLEAHRCGWWIDVGVEPLAAALREATGLSDDQRSAMGQRGRQYVEREFSWDRAAGEMHEVYRWMLRGGTPPSCVVLN